MYMRYAGNGIGHYKVDLADDARAAVPSVSHDDAEDGVPVDMGEPENNAGAPMEETDGDDAEQGEGPDDNDEEDGDEEGNDDEEPEPDDSGDSDDNLGAEDGEGGFVDLEDEEGYAPL